MPKLLQTLSVRRKFVTPQRIRLRGVLLQLTQHYKAGEWS